MEDYFNNVGSSLGTLVDCQRKDMELQDRLCRGGQNEKEEENGGKSKVDCKSSGLSRLTEWNGTPFYINHIVLT